MSAFATIPNTRANMEKKDSACDIIAVINKFLASMVTGIIHFG